MAPTILTVDGGALARTMAMNTKIRPDWNCVEAAGRLVALSLGRRSAAHKGRC